jgi:hypothetical protein
MATDNSEPRIGMIVGIGLLSIVTLLGLRMLFQSYFIMVTEEEQQAKIFGKPAVELQRLRDEERQRLTSGSVSIDQAVRAFSSGSRPAGLSPMPSTDWAALQGWSQRPVPSPNLPRPAQGAVQTPPTGTAPVPAGSTPAPPGSPVPAPSTAPTQNHPGGMTPGAATP